MGVVVVMGKLKKHAIEEECQHLSLPSVLLAPSLLSLLSGYHCFLSAALNQLRANEKKENNHECNPLRAFVDFSISLTGSKYAQTVAAKYMTVATKNMAPVPK